MINFTFLNFFRINENKAWQQLLVLAFLLNSLDGFSQVNHSLNKGDNYSTDKKPYKVVSFGEKIFFGNIENTANWTVTSTRGSLVANLIGNQINEFIFEEPGFYEIRFFESIKKNTDGCNHSLFPEKMGVKVNTVKMIFDFSKIEFSKKIEKGISCDDITVTVPVNIFLKENIQVKCNSPSLVVSGVSAEIKAKPIVPDIILRNGIQFLKYQLSGIVSKETYLMFDFIDFNNQAQTYNLLEIVN
jgi:hypothetical protein